MIRYRATGKFASRYAVVDVRYAFDPRTEGEVSNLATHMRQGTLASLYRSSNAILLGDRLADKIGARVNSSITLASAEGATMSANVVGTFHSGFRATDETTGYVLLKTAFEAEPSTPGIMHEPPRKGASLFGRRELLISVVQGLMIMMTAFSIYYGLPQSGYETTEARAAAFIATILGNLTLAFANSAEVGTSFFDARRGVFWGIFASMAAVVAILLTAPQAGALFQVTAPPLPVIAFTTLGGLAAGSWFGFGKLLASVWPFASRNARSS